MKNSTLAVHAGTRHDPEFPGVNSPVYVSTSYPYLDTEERIYPRYFNTPNQQVLAEKLNALEGTDDALLLSSGMAAISTVIFGLLKKGDHVVFQPALYGGAYHFAAAELANYGIDHSFSESADAETMEKALRPETRLIYIETPSNPLLEITDIKAIAEMARRRGVLTAVDNTFASPVNQNPYRLGIDVVIHSATKYLGGHSDLAAGAIASSREIISRLRNMALSLGGSLNALDCYLLERSMKTLFVRVEKQNESAMQIATFLEKQTQIRKVFYPGLPSHPKHHVAAAQMYGFGGMLSFELARIDATAFQKKLKVIRPSMSLGGVESIVCSPAMTSHRHLSREEQERSGINGQVLRLSVGVEDPSDLIDDLRQAMESSR